jgi:predicted nucleic acid-binding protein
VRGMLVDTSVWIDFFSGETIPVLEEGLAGQVVILSPVVIAELVSGAVHRRERRAITDLVLQLPVHDTPVEHWVAVGELRRKLRTRGLSVSTPDAHIAQCALDRQALLLSRDSIFGEIAAVIPLWLVREACVDRLRASAPERV